MPSEKQVSRNEPCPCGSGKKYKHCCGSLAAQPGPGIPTRQLLIEAEGLRNAGQHETAKSKYEDILRLDPTEARAATGLGLCLIQLGETNRGLDELRRAVSLAPGELACINHLIVNLFNLGKVEESLEWAKKAVTMGSEGAKTNVLLANCYEKLHRLDEALEANRLAQMANPGVSYLKLQQAKLHARKGDHARARDILQEAIRASGLDPMVRSQMLGELGRVLDKLDNHAEAYEAFSQSGVEATRSPETQKFKLGYRPGLIKAYTEGLSSERLRKWKADDIGDDGWTPVFLVGFPRSGTTMTEQILAAHSGIITMEERPFVEQVRYEWARIVGANPDFGWMADQLDAGAILQLRKFYRKKVEIDRGAPIGSATLIDKLPLNIMHIGLINLVFPDAKVIVSIRDPRDACISCFMQDFELNSAMIHFLSLEQTVEFYTQVMGAWLHFRDIISVSHLAIRYEDIVRDLEHEAQRLIDYLGLDWEPGILKFHQKAEKRVIQTPSYTAVTEPVHTRAIGRWKNYRQQFDPLMPSLEPYVKAFGYGD